MRVASSHPAPSRGRSVEFRKQELSPARRALVELFQEINFGEIHDLQVHRREPVLDPPPEVFRDLVLGKENTPHAARSRADFTLKKEVVELFDLFDREQQLVIVRLIVQAGLPLRLRVRTTRES